MQAPCALFANALHGLISPFQFAATIASTAGARAGQLTQAMRSFWGTKPAAGASRQAALQHQKHAGSKAQARPVQQARQEPVLRGQSQTSKGAQRVQSVRPASAGAAQKPSQQPQAQSASQRQNTVCGISDLLTAHISVPTGTPCFGSGCLRSLHCLGSSHCAVRHTPQAGDNY